ncbi:MAG: response regulator [Deltaproteobacteria bacterium]
MAGEKIMVVDDNKEFLEEISETLFLCGYEPKTVLNSTAAAYLAGKMHPDLILLDLRMNRMNGFQVAEQLKKSKQTSDIPIIAMSGYFPVEKQTLLDLSNMEGRLRKPFAIFDLINQIEAILAAKKNKQNSLTP